MEKIVIGAPYEISIEPSIDIGKFNSEIRIKLKESVVAIDLKPIKGEKDSYSFIVPTFLKDIVGKKPIDYCICVYKENARFEVDEGTLQFIDEKDFEVKVKDNKKMRRIDEPKEDKAEEGTKKSKEEKPPEREVEAAKESVEVSKPGPPLDPVELAEELIQRQHKNTNSQNQTPPSIKQQRKADNRPLGAILEGIESRKDRDKLNENIRNAIRGQKK